MSVRAATHAGTWYIGSKGQLQAQLESLLAEASEGPKKGARLLVGPHAGYSYAGPTLAETYKVWDSSGCKRVFILGPSHHVYFRGAKLSNCRTYETPLGDVPVDVETIASLRKHRELFQMMTLEEDEDEHSFEMHMPFLYQTSKHLPGGPPKIIPIMIGQTSVAYEKSLAAVLAPYMENPENTFVVSTDFCHWGQRFEYTAYRSSGGSGPVTFLGMSSASKSLVRSGQPIYKSIELLDKEGMEACSSRSYDIFLEYFKRTGNTICGRKPLSIVMATVERILETNLAGEDCGRFHWIGYAQSSAVTSISDSSVSYASGYAVV